MFTEHCFILKNTLYIKEALEKLRYKPSSTFRSLEKYIFTSGYRFYSTDNKFLSKINIGITYIPYGICCEKNEDLFLAIAALRDDTDANQWFTDGKVWEKTEAELPSRYMQMNGHKATIKELIEYFK